MARWKKASNIQHLMKMIELDISNDSLIVAKSIGQDVHDMIYLYTQAWYNARPESEFYERTYEFINSLTIEEPVRMADVWFIGIHFDPDKMNEGLNSAGYWHQHDDKYELSEIIDNGWKAYNKNIQGSHAIERTIEYLRSSGFLRDLSSEFTKRGYNIRKVRES